MLKPKKKVNTGNPLLDKAIKSSNAKKAAAKKKAAAAKKKANLGPVKGGAATVAGKNPLSYLTKAADSQVKKKKQGDQNKKDKKTVQAAKIDRFVDGFNKVMVGKKNSASLQDKPMSKRLKAALEAEKRLYKNKKKKTR